MMLSSQNLLKPATGEPITLPTQDIVLGCYYLTKVVKNTKGEGKVLPPMKRLCSPLKWTI